MRLLIISHDIIGTRMAGPGIRYWELARALASAAEVTLAAPAPIDLTPQGFTLASYTPAAPKCIASLCAASDLVLANGHVLAFYPALADLSMPLILDLYDPVPLENLELFRSASPAQRTAQADQDAALLRTQLCAGDYFLCATERQRDLYLGALLALGRVTPALYDQDPLLRNLLDVVSFGLPTEPPTYTAPALRTVLPGVDAATNLLLWSGGLWDWMDPLSVIRAMPAVLKRHPRTCLVFLAGAHPGGAAPMRRPDEARALAAELNLIGGAIQFYDQWIPYAFRANALLEADLLVSLGQPGLESAYAAVRSRFLDHLWAGRASLVSAGDAASDLVATHRLGLVVPPNDVAATAAAIITLLDSPDERAACAVRAHALAQAYTWERVTAPLRAFCLQPRRTRPPAASDQLVSLTAQQVTPQASQKVTVNASHPPMHTLPIDPPPVAIIMRTWNGLAYTRECLESLRALSGDIEYNVIVVDNGSTDGTREYLRGLDWVELIENQANVGSARGNNQGIAAAPVGWDVLLLNHDLRITQGNWLRRLREVAHSDPAYGIVGARLLASDGKLLHAGMYMPTDSFWGWQIGNGEEEIGQYQRVRTVEGIVATCMYLRYDVIENVGAFDERFFSCYEDTDYCLRAQQAGYRIVVAGDVSLIHHEHVSASLNKLDAWSTNGTSQAIFRAKWEQHYHSRYRNHILWHSLVSAPTGYAVSSRQLLIHLDRLGVDARLAYLYGTDLWEQSTGDPRIEQLRHRPKDTSLVQVVYSQCDAFYKNSGRYRIGFSMLEVTGIPAEWVTQSNLMDEIWVPSHFNRETFRNSGVTRPIHTIPLGIDPDYFHPQIKAHRFSERFTFLSVFEWGERKAPELLMRAFCAAFDAQDDVVLVLKIDNRDSDVNVAQQIAAMDLPRNAPKIVLLYNQELPGYQLGSLYRAADCFVTATRGEGWGMPILEAMACGLPAIATNWSAQTEFMRDDLCYPLRVARLIPAVARTPYYTGYKWADPDFEHLVYLLRHVYEQRDQAAAVGVRAAAAVAREWTWEHAALKIMARLREVEV